MSALSLSLSLYLSLSRSLSVIHCLSSHFYTCMLPFTSALDLSENQLTGSIPASLTSLRSLLALFLENNNLTGTVPTGLNNIVLQVRCDARHTHIFLHQPSHVLRRSPRILLTPTLSVCVQDLSGNSFSSYSPPPVPVATTTSVAVSTQRCTTHFPAESTFTVPSFPPSSLVLTGDHGHHQ